MGSIETARAEQVAVLTMAHGKANAFDVDFMRALREALDSAVRSDARALVITATGAIFSAGVDLPRVLRGDRAYLEEFLSHLSDGLAELFAVPKPVVAAVNGHAIAGGAIIACACDYRLMARGGARIGVPELRVGVPFPMVPAEIVRYALGHQRAQRAMLVGQVVETGQAVEEGFVDELVEPEALMDRALEVATAMAATPPATYARSKRDLRRPVLETWKRLRDSHDRETLEAWDSPAVRGAIEAYVGKTLHK
jgi:enoyl-CoA hydratase